MIEFSDNDIKQITKHGLSVTDVQKQLNKEIPEAQIGVLSYSESLDILRKKSAESSDE